MPRGRLMLSLTCQKGVTKTIAMKISKNDHRSSNSRPAGRSLRRLSPLLMLALCATLLPAALAQDHDFRLTGWATAGDGVTGGAGGATVTASTAEELVKYIGQAQPLIIQVKGSIDLGQTFPGSNTNARYYVASDKTIVGMGADAEIRRGDLRLSEVRNIIIRNLAFRDAPDDALTITHGTTHVWIDHNDFANAADGLLDITRAADFITVSWNRFANQDKVSLVGASDGATGDRGHLRVTYHHNWFFETNQRHARVRYGQVHLFNNLYSRINVGVGIGIEAQIISENNYFDNASRPFHNYDASGPGYTKSTGDIVNGGDLIALDESGIKWSPKDHYTYSANAAGDVPELVMSGAGVGVIDPFAEAAPPANNPTEPAPPAEPDPTEPDGSAPTPGDTTEKKAPPGKALGRKS